jgi:hypothetical protein
MRTIALAFTLLLLAAPSQAAPKASQRNNDVSLEQRCRDMVGKEVGEGEGRSGINRAQVQRWDDCMMGRGQ